MVDLNSVDFDSESWSVALVPAQCVCCNPALGNVMSLLFLFLNGVVIGVDCSVRCSAAKSTLNGRNVSLATV